MIKLPFFKRKKTRWPLMPNDIFIVSYPRSGNTWMRKLMANLLEPGEDWNITNLGRVVPDIYEPFPEDYIYRSPRILKSHECYENSYRKVVYLYRDGRDVLASYYDYKRKIKGYKNPFDRFLKDALSGNIEYGSWQKHVSSWMFSDRETFILPVKYEDMVKDTKKELEKIGLFIGVHWEQNRIDAAIENSSFEKLLNDYKTLKFETHWKKGFKGGIIGAGKNRKDIFSENQNQYFWEKAGEVAYKLGYIKR